MSLKEDINNVINFSERKITGLKTNLREFKYVDNDSFVKPNTIYSIYYTKNKEEVFITGLKGDRFIEPVVIKSIFGQYSQLNNKTRNEYPRGYNLKPSKADYRIGEVIRYFTQKYDNSNNPFEIDEDTYNDTNTLYKYTTFKWTISGLKQDVEIKNTKLIKSLEIDYPGISQVLFPLQLWTPPKDSKEDLENKLSRLKK